MSAAPSPPSAADLLRPAPRLILAERVAVGLALGLVLAAFTVRPLAERCDPVLRAELHAHYDGDATVRDDASWLIPQPCYARIFGEIGLPALDPWGEAWVVSSVRGASTCRSAGPDRAWGTNDDVSFTIHAGPRWPHEPIICARSALLALATGITLVALLARTLPRPGTTGQDIGVALALSGAAIGALVPFTTGWVDSLPDELRDALSARLLVDARHAIVGSVVIVTFVGVLLLRLGRRAVDPPPPEVEPEVGPPPA
jgi:hypothetical protein